MDKNDYQLSSEDIRDIDFIHMGNEHSRDDVRTLQWTVRNKYGGKPDHVIWTSPCTKQSDKSDWEDFCGDGDYNYCGKYRWHIVPTDECRMLIIDTKKDLINLDKYRFKESPKDINFEALAEDYDAFYFTNNAIMIVESCGLPYKLFCDFEQYNVASGVFFNSDTYMMMTEEEFQLYKKHGVKPAYLSEKKPPKPKIKKNTEPLVYKNPISDYRTIKPNPKYFGKKKFLSKEEIKSQLRKKGAGFLVFWKNHLLEELEKCQPAIPEYDTDEAKENFYMEKCDYYENADGSNQPASNDFCLKRKYYDRREFIEGLKSEFENHPDEVPYSFTRPQEFIFNEPDMFHVLVEHGLNLQNYFRFTETIDEVKALLDLGAKLDEPSESYFDTWGYPIQFAKTQEVLEFYINNGANPELLHVWQIYPFKRWEYLLKIGLDPNYKGENGDTVLFHCNPSSSDDKSPTDLAELFLQYGADPNIRNDKGLTPLLKQLNDFKTCELFLRYGADPNIRDAEGKVPLMYAKKPELIELLLVYGADPTATDKNGKSVMDYVSENRIGNKEGINLIKRAIIEKMKKEEKRKKTINVSANATLKNKSISRD